MAGWPAVRALLGRPGPALTADQDWLALRREGLLGLVAEAAAAARLPLPADVREALFAAIAFELRSRHVLKEISEAAGERGLPVLALKGCSLARGLYPRPGLRSFGDLDVAIPAAQEAGLREVLHSLGFRPNGPDTMVREGFSLDLHQHPLQQLQELVGPVAVEWWGATQALAPDTGLTRRLAYQHEFVLALMHGAKHAFSRAYWLLDLALLAERLDPAALQEAVLRHGARRQLSYAAACLDDWFGVSLPGLPCRWNPLERRFVSLVLQRRAPDYLGMLTPVSSAQNMSAALRYLRGALYPEGVSVWRRTWELLGMLKGAWRA